MRMFPLVPIASAACVLATAGAAHAAYRITGIDIYGRGVITASEPFAPPVGASNPIHVSVTFFPPAAGLPPIPIDATGTFNFQGFAGGGWDVTIFDRGGIAPCEFCTATFSLVNGQLTGPFSFSSGVYPTHFVAVDNTTFYGEVLGPGVDPVGYSGTWTPQTIVVRTDAPVPEPATWLLMITGFLGAGQALRRMRDGRGASAPVAKGVDP